MFLSGWAGVTTSGRHARPDNTYLLTYLLSSDYGFTVNILYQFGEWYAFLWASFISTFTVR